MKSILPKNIQKLPKADIFLDGANIYVSQAKDHQIVFMEFQKEVTIPEHSHKSQWEIVLQGTVDVWIDGLKHTYSKGDQFFIPNGVKHHAKIPKGYASIAFFNEKNRYNIK